VIEELPAPVQPALVKAEQRNLLVAASLEFIGKRIYEPENRAT
jgi:hypothetical protein